MIDHDEAQRIYDAVEREYSLTTVAVPAQRIAELTELDEHRVDAALAWLRRPEAEPHLQLVEIDGIEEGYVIDPPGLARAT